MKTRIVVISLLLAAALFSRPLYAEEYTVREGDTLRRIAGERLGDVSRWREIADANNIAPPYTLLQGERLVIPSNKSGADSGESPISYGVAEPPPASPLSQTFGILEENWMMLPLIPLCLLVLYVVCLRIGCWFSLVNTTFKRCCILALLLVAVTVAFVAAGWGIVVESAVCRGSVTGAAIVIGGIFAAYFVASFLLTQQVLHCKLRSVVPVWIMTSVIANAIATLLMFCITGFFFATSKSSLFPAPL